MSKKDYSILDCLTDLISIRGGCEEVIPSSGIYLDDIGLSLNNIDEFVTRDYSDSYDLFAKKKELSIRLIENQIAQYLSDRYLTHTLLESQRLGFFQDDLNLIAGAAGIRKGINIEFYNFDSYIDLNLDEITIQLNYAGPVQVLVYDLLDNELLDTIKITSVANEEITVYPNKKYLSSRKKLNLIFVVKAVDSNGNEVVVSSNTTYLRPLGAGGCVGCTGGNVYRNSWAWARSVSIDDALPKIKKNLQGSNDTGGLSIIYSLNCNHRQWVCTIAQSLALPMAYKVAYELIDFAMTSASSERTNTFVFANGDSLEKRLLSYEKKYAESITNVLQNIKLPSDSNCFVCNSRTMNKIILP